MSFIEIRHVTHCYDGGTARALDDVDYSIERGEFFALLGSSGCGKSTLLNIIGGFVDPSAGSITVAGQDILSVPAYKRNIGTVFQSYALFPHMTVFDNVAYGLRLKTKDKKAIAARVEECLALVHLEDFARRRPHQLSGGQQQRVAIARALALSPDILCFDEPTSALDPELTGEVLKVIRGLAEENTTMLIVTHEMAFARDVADQVIFMDNGMIVECGDAKQVIDAPREERTRKFLARYADGAK